MKCGDIWNYISELLLRMSTIYTIITIARVNKSFNIKTLIFKFHFYYKLAKHIHYWRTIFIYLSWQRFYNIYLYLTDTVTKLTKACIFHSNLIKWKILDTNPAYWQYFHLVSVVFDVELASWLTKNIDFYTWKSFRSFRLLIHYAKRKYMHK